jgi:hypothetical protein
MDSSERGRKRRDVAPASREVPESVPPPARRRRELHELDPETLWDKENSDESAEEVEGEEEGFGDDSSEDAVEEGSNDDLDDWDHPIRRLKIN